MTADAFVTGILAFLAGIVLGLFYFGGLWWTVRRLPRAGRPVVWYLGSFGLRTVLILAAFYVILEGGWEKLIISSLGFISVRFWMVRRIEAQLRWFQHQRAKPEA